MQFLSVFVTIEAHSLAGIGRVGFCSILGPLGAEAYYVVVLPYSAATESDANDMPTARALVMLAIQRQRRCRPGLLTRAEGEYGSLSGISSDFSAGVGVLQIRGHRF